MNLRDSFVERFGEEQCAAVERAACEHANGINDVNKGSNHFRWCISIVLGYQCVSKDSFRTYHGITAPWPDMQRWIKDNAHLERHDGDVDYLALFAGVYDEYMPLRAREWEKEKK